MSTGLTLFRRRSQKLRDRAPSQELHASATTASYNTPEAPTPAPMARKVLYTLCGHAIEESCEVKRKIRYGYGGTRLEPKPYTHFPSRCPECNSELPAPKSYRKLPDTYDTSRSRTFEYYSSLLTGRSKAVIAALNSGENEKAGNASCFMSFIKCDLETAKMLELAKVQWLSRMVQALCEEQETFLGEEILEFLEQEFVCKVCEASEEGETFGERWTVPVECYET